MAIQVIKDRNAGNAPNTYWKGKADREFCIQVGTNYARDAKGRVRRFASRAAAQQAADKLDSPEICQ